MAQLSGRGYAFTVVTDRWGDDLPVEDERGGVPIFRFPFHAAIGKRDVEAMAEIRHRLGRVVGGFDPDLVHLNFTGPSGVFLLGLPQLRDVPLVVTVHNAPPGGDAGPGALTGRILRSARRVVVPSEALGRHIRDLLPDLEPRVSVIRNALRPPPIEPRPLPFDAPRVLFVGRLLPEKGFDVALEAFPEVVGRYPRARLVVAGEGTQRETLERRAAELGVADAVDFLGRVDPEKVPGIINTATLMVVPSRWFEVFGLVALEGALMGRPVVASRVGGLPEVVVEGRTGLLVEPGDVHALARAVLFLLENPDRCASMGRSARERALEDFGWEPLVDAYDRLFRSLHRGSTGGRPGSGPSSRPPQSPWTR